MKKLPSLVIGIVLAHFNSAAHSQYVWQSNEVAQAWRSGYLGQGATIHVHDSFAANTLHVKLDSRSSWENLLWWKYTDLSHGEVVSRVAQSTALLAKIERNQWNDGTIKLQEGRFNVVNLSYGLVGSTNQATVEYAKSLQVASIAASGAGLVVKAAGNAGRSLSDSGGGDALNIALKSSGAVIFAGALEEHGTNLRTTRYPWGSYTPGTRKADYSNSPGSDHEYQSKFLMVGVPSTLTTSGTSFAAPQISGYAAIVSSKFRSATPAGVANQLLGTARTDRISGYDPTLHGKGEASLTRALAPKAIR